MEGGGAVTEREDEEQDQREEGEKVEGGWGVQDQKEQRGRRMRE